MVLQGPRGSFPQSLRGKGFPHPLPFIAQRPSQQYSLFFRTGVAITSSMKPPLICQGRGRGLLFCVPRIPFAKWSSQFSASLLPHPRFSLLKSNEFHVVVGFGGFRFLFLSLFLISVPPSFWKLSSHLGAGKSAFCLQIQSHKLWLKGNVGWLLFYMQLKIFIDCDENNSKQDRHPQWCGFCFF